MILPQHYIIGSKLFRFLFPTNTKIQKRCSGNKDVDVLIFNESDMTISNKNVFKCVYGEKTELHYIPVINTYLTNNLTSDKLKNVYFTLKASHIPWDTIHREKTFYDLYLMSEERCEIITELYYKLNEYWTTKFGKKWRADFTKESIDFFDDAISREHIHDELHEKVKKFDKPAFKYLQEPNQTTVYVDEIKFNTASDEIKRSVIIEEAQVLALERFLIPKIKQDQYLSYCHFIKVLIERCAPLWMTIYILNNYNYFITLKETYYDSEI